LVLPLQTCDRNRVAPLINNAARFFNLTRQENVARFCGLCIDYYGAVYQRPVGAQALAPKLAELSAENRRALATDVARALQHLHANDVVHGALTSRCIELRPMDLPGGVTFGACVLDWGLGDVKVVTERDEECKWMAAEQIDGAPSKPADVWSLGCVIRCALYGAAAPWDGFAPVDAAELIRTGATPRPPNVKGLDVPLPVRTATQQCWAREPAARKSASEVYDTLNDWLDAGDPAAAAAKASDAAPSSFTPAPAKETFTPAPAKVVTAGGEVFTPAPIKDEGPTPWLGKPWHYPEITRPQAEALLRTQPAGSFVVRNSSQAGVNALTFIQQDGAIGHGLLYKENGTWSVEKKPPFHATLEVLLRTHAGLVYDAAQQAEQRQKFKEMFPAGANPTLLPAPQQQQQQHAPPPSADGAPSAAEGIVVCGRCEAIPAEVDCAQCAMLFCRGCSADLHGKGLFRMHALKPHANTLTPGTAAVVVAPPPRQRPSEADYVNKSWYRPDWDRVTADQVLGAMAAGAFGLRPSSQPMRLALSHSKGGGAVGHAIIHIHNGENNRYGYSIEDRDITYPTLEQLLSGLADLRFDLVPPPPAASNANMARSTSPPPAAKPAAAAAAPAQQKSVAPNSAEFSAFLPRAVRKDESGRFEAPKYAALGQSQAMPATASALSNASAAADDELAAKHKSMLIGESDEQQLVPDDDLPPDDLPPDGDLPLDGGAGSDVGADEYQSLPADAGGFALPPPPSAAGGSFGDGEYGIMPTEGYGHMPESFAGRDDPSRRHSDAHTEYAQIELPDEADPALSRHGTRQSVRLSLSTMAQLVGDDFGLDDSPIGPPPARPQPVPATAAAAVATAAAAAPPAPAPSAAVAPAAAPAAAPRAPKAAAAASKQCSACGKERAAKRVTMSDGTKVKLCNACCEGIRVGSLVLTRDELTGALVISEPPSPLVSSVSGPGLTQTIVDRPTQVIVIGHTADGQRCEVGGALVSAVLSDPQGVERSLRVIDRGDGSYVVGFVCLAPGVHALHVGLQRTPSAPVQGVGKSPYVITASNPTTASAGVCVDCRRNPAAAVFRQAGVVSYLCAPCTSMRDRVAPGQAQITLLSPEQRPNASPRSAIATPSPPAASVTVLSTKSSPSLNK
jgi:serine/threonine protein kinase